MAVPAAVDFFNLDDDAAVKVAIVSSISSQVVADRLIRFLNEESKDSKLGWQTLPGEDVLLFALRP